ncbi:MAG TPA: bifunctional precorrin-2 dehydrogenase/sirohydrochlorin ferrochelatase [Candidatus Binatia bacterium]|jgi:siroheme synthase-like protein
MAYYPIFMNLSGQRCLVIGGGAVAERKVEGLLEAAASVTLVSPMLTETLERWVKEKKIRHYMREYRKGDLAGYRLAFVATDNPPINRAVYEEAQEAGVLLNSADDPAHCDFILPSVLRRGELQVAVATGGASPALSRAIREELEEYFSEDYELLSDVVADVRRELKEKGIAADAESWRRALNGDVRRLVHEGDIEAAKRRLREEVAR